jgi:cytochrome c
MFIEHSVLADRVPTRTPIMFRNSALIALVAALAGSPAAAAGMENGRRDAAMRMVERVQRTLSSHGPDVTFSAINQSRHPMNAAFKDGTLYPFVFDMHGWSVADGANVKMVGKNWIRTRDPLGRELIRQMIRIAEGPGSGWVEYKWPHPLTHKIQDKSAYVEKLGDQWFVGVGVYIER